MTELPDLYGYDSSYRIWETFRLCRAYALVPHLRGDSATDSHPFCKLRVIRRQ